MQFLKKMLFYVVMLAIFAVVVILVYHRLRPNESVESQQPGMVNDVVRRASGAGSETQQWSTDKIREALAEFNSYFPIFHDAGFSVTEVRVEAGVFPCLTATFTQIKAISPDEQADILRAQKNKKVLSYILSSLFKVYGVNMGNFKLTSVDINLSLTPSTTLVLAPLDDQSGATPAGSATPTTPASGSTNTK